MSRQYSNPPLEEAVCEFRFRSTDPWDLTVPGMIYSPLAEQYPRRLPARVGGVTAIRIGPEGIHQQIAPQDTPGIISPELRIWHQEDTGEIVIAPYRIAVHHRKPYPSWARFLPIIQQALGAYRSAASPESIQRIGLRYVNKIRFDITENLRLENYFDFHPFLGDNLPSTISAIGMRAEFPFNNERDRLRLQLSSAQDEDAGQFVITLDLDYFLVELGSVPFDEVPVWLETAHDHVESAFEGCLKESMREKFDQEDA